MTSFFGFFEKRCDPVLCRLAKYVVPYKWHLLLAVICMSFVAGTTALTSVLLGKLMDKGFYEQDSQMIVAAPVLLIAVTLMFALASVAGNYLLTKISQKILITLRTQMFANLLRWPLTRYQTYSTGLVCSKFVNEANIALRGAVQSVLVMARDSLQVLWLFAVLVWQDWQLTLVACVVGPVAAFLLRRVRRHMRDIVNDSQKAIADTLSRVQESYEAQRVVKISGTYDFEAQRFKTINEAIRKTGLNKLKLQSLGTPITQVVTMMGVAVVVAFAMLKAQQGGLSFGDFITFLSAMLFLMTPLQNLAGLNATFTAVSVAGKSLFSLIDEPLQPDNGTVELPSVKGAIAFENARVRYAGAQEDALKGLSLSVKPGEHIALVGHSGSGKTTTVNLIPRFVDVTGGAVTIDGVDVREFSLENLHKHIAVVSQDVIMFEGTIRENITYGLETSTVETVMKACEAAALTDLINTLPHGLDTQVGAAGNLLSGGQKQRISIARALLKNAPILILDEATSALDSESEHTIKQALERLMKGRTTLTVAHRLSTIENADRIVVMDKGEIVEMGTPAELLVKGGIYARLKKLQVLDSE